MKWLPALVALFAFSALAADISGNWKATAEGPNGAMERTFTFKQDAIRSPARRRARSPANRPSRTARWKAIP